MFGSLPAALAGSGGGGTTPAAQMRSWLFAPNLVNFSSGTATASTQGSGTGRVSAAAFDAANQLLFSVSFGFGSNSQTVFTPANVAVGQLQGINNPNQQTGETDWSGFGRETVVVPVPGACSKYYLFYTLAGNFSTVVAYAIIDCSSGTPVIAQNSQRVNNERYYGAPGLAASQAATNGTRTLYIAGGTAAVSYQLLTGSGFGSATPVASGDFSGGSCEAELSPDGSRLAWARLGSNQVTVAFTGSSPGAPNSFVPVYASGPATNSVNGVSGLEFSSGSDKLFVAGQAAGQGGAAVYTVATGAQSPIATGGHTLAAATQVELAFDGLLYAASSTGSLLTINPSTLAVAASPLAFTTTLLSVVGVGGSVYGFPDQIDGENYAVSYSVSPPTMSAALTVDGRFLSPNAFRPVYSCNPLRFNGTVYGNNLQLSIVINSVDANNNLTGTYSFTHSTTTLPVDLAPLNGGYLADPRNTGYYRVQLIATNLCGQTAQATARMQVSNLTPSSAGFAFNECSGTGPQAASTSPTAPAVLGAAGGGGIDISFSSGDYERYQVQFAQYVSGSSPPQFTPIGSLADIAKPSGVGLNTIGITFLAGQAGLEPSYFQQGRPGFGLLHRLTLTVSNRCATSPPLLGYFEATNILCRTAQGPGTAPVKAPLYPNPLTGTEVGHLRFTLPTAQPVSLVLTDALTGQVRLTVLRNEARAAGEQEVTFDAGKLAAGVYLYRLTTAEGTTVGRLLKAD